MDVKTFLEQNPSKKIWLCPNEHSSCNITPIKYEYGLTYERVLSIPTEILNSEVIKTWIEEDGEFADYRCIVWKNFRLGIDK